MAKFIDWVISKFQHPLSLLFFLLGAILILLGLTTGISVPGLQQITPDVNFRWVALGLGIVLILVSVILYYRPPRIVSTTEATKVANSPSVADQFVTRLGTNSERFIERLSQAERITVIGITNQNLVQFLEKALEVKRKNQTPISFWQSIRIVFLSETALNTIHDELRTEYTDKNQANLVRTRNAGRAKRTISYFFIRTLHSREWSLFEYDATIPFVGVLYEMPNGRTIAEIATLRPYAGQTELLYFEFSDEKTPQIVNYYKNVFEDVIQQSIKHDEVVIVGNPLPQSKGFIWKHSKFRRSVLESNPHSDNWIAVVMVLLWRKNEEGKIEPLLQVRTPENATRELDTLSNIAGYINQLDCQEFDGKSATDVVLQKSAYENAIYRELQEELGIKQNWLKPKLIDEIRFYYPDKENLFFYVCSMEIGFPLFQIEPNAHMRPWDFQQILKVREYQVLSRVHSTLESAPNKTLSPIAIDALADNLILHQHVELAEMLHDSVYTHSTQREEMQSKVSRLMEQCSQFYVFQDTRRQIRGLAELQYREFFSTLVNAYSKLGVPRAQEYQDLISKDVNMSNALARSRKFYGSETLIRKVGIDILRKSPVQNFPHKTETIEFFDYIYKKYKRYWYPELGEDERYSVVLNHSKNWDILLKNIGKTKPGLALDLGAGEGTDAIKLALLGYDVDAVEGSAIGAEKIEAFSQKAHRKVNVIHKDVNTFEPTCTYDVIICNGLLHYVENKLSVLEKIKASTRKDGFVLISLFSDFTPTPECHQVVNVYPDAENGIIRSFFSQGWETLYFQFQRNRLEVSHPGFPVHYHSFIKMVLQKTE